MAENPPLAVVTGGAHRLGRDLALFLAAQGYSILVHCHESSEAAQKTADEIVALGARAYVICGDLKDPTQVLRLFETVDSTGCPLRVLINSAAVMEPVSLLEIDFEDFDSAIDLNLRAPMMCAKNAAQRMETGSVIVNISDVGARKNWVGFPVYVISKAGLESFTRLLARVLAPKIRVNAIAPGLVYRSEHMSSDEWGKLVSRVPLGRSAKPSEITRALEFILKNEYVTGQTIVVDGGYSLI